MVLEVLEPLLADISLIDFDPLLLFYLVQSEQG